jgi:hypothetical protein
MRIEQAAVCASINNKAPAGISDRFSKDAKAIYYFTHITGVRDTAAVVHRWYHEGKLIQTSILQVKSTNWRTHSKRSLINSPDMVVGSWRVEAVDQKTGKVLESATFVVE